jgi:uncharacterized membrane protein
MNTSIFTHHSQSSGYDTQRGESDMQKMALFIAAGSAMAFGIARKGVLNRLLAVGGGYLLFRAMTGDKSGSNDVLVSQTINKPLREVYSFFRDPLHWPRLEASLGSSPMGLGENQETAEDSLQLTDEAQDRTIRWHFEKEDAAVEISAHFAPAPGNRGTEVWLFAECMSPASGLRELLKSARGRSLEQVAREHLRNCKRLMEAGEILTTDGQSSGDRGMKGKAMRALLRESMTEGKPSAATRATAREQRVAS